MKIGAFKGIIYYTALSEILPLPHDLPLLSDLDKT
jgi:hypothetical protein